MVTSSNATPYLQPTPHAGRHFVMKQISGEVYMLNLLRFREVADYSTTPELMPLSPISGAEAFQRYIQHTLPFLHKSGGDIIFLGAADSWLIGPQDERWDCAMLVRQSSAGAFLAFVDNEAYLQGIGHRTAALEDSRLLPMTQRDSLL
ncbi:DUF1330 domain-containing protein [Cedecea sp. NFIX57]|uniref:DUF1330 domain-containing protein n=1 Tax=Cedecea sp. NFIX57 TaxID=1566286 RepID=UPI000A0D9D41|nr:DUF1330 domain-containing protein [Cedecea sp. NFIX57]SMG22789.1 hypothetical protein SAMN03159353_1004224 [Cedecea sp. NFIX57]